MTNLSAFQRQFLHLKGEYEKLPKVRPKRITIPEIFGRSDDENFISDYVAYILDPYRNGIGIEPLQALLSLCGKDIPPSLLIVLI